MENGIKHQLTPEERAEYEAPVAESASRLPMLQWPREIPIDGEPADVQSVIDLNGQWLGSSKEVPKLQLTFDGAPLSRAEVVDWAKRSVARLEVVALGAAGHHAPEDASDAIVRAINAFIDRQR